MSGTRRIRAGASATICATWLLLGGIAAVAARPAAATSSADDATFSLSRSVDPDGLSFLVKARQRTPTGFLYPYPLEPPDGLVLGDWKLRGLAEVGWAESWGSRNEAYFERYTDHRDGAIDSARLEAHDTTTGAYAEFGALAIGRDDVSAFLDAGQRGWLRVRAYYDELPHRYANDARILFDGVGSEHLTLPSGLVAGGNSDAAIDAALANRGNSRLALQRDKTGVEVQLDANRALTLRAGYRTEERSGERPFGGAIRFAFQNPNLGSVVETVEPLSSRTHDFHGDLALADEHAQIDMGYEGSLFDNHVQSLTWDNPFPATNVDQGRFALTPDNFQHRLHGTVSYLLPARGRWTSTASWISAEQNERLLAPTINGAFPDWVNPATSLSRKTAEARVDTTLVTSTLRLSPLRSLGIGASVRYQRRDNHTKYFALNPAIDDYGYVIEDGSFGVRERFGAAPYDTDQLAIKGDASLRVASGTRLAIEYEYERAEREQRARALTLDHRGRISLSTRQIPRTTVRLAYEFSDRSGSSFQRERDARYYSVGPPDFSRPLIGTPQTSLSTFEQHDLADRRVHDANLRVNFQLGEIADLSFTGGGRDEDYDLRYGLQRVRAANANVELDLQPTPAIDAYAYGSSEWRERKLDTIDSATFIGSDFTPGGPVFPFDGAWDLRSREQSLAFGTGLSARPWKALELRADYQVALSRERISYDYASEAAFAPGVTAQDAGSHLPSLRNADHVVEASARLALSEQISARILYRYMNSTIANFHQDGLVPRIGHVLYLGHRDGDFAAHVVGGTVQFRF
jgi:MtrB/PioB family decaheme-associated outer membrane protein